MPSLKICDTVLEWLRYCITHAKDFHGKLNNRLHCYSSVFRFMYLKRKLQRQLVLFLLVEMEQRINAFKQKLTPARIALILN